MTGFITVTYFYQSTFAVAVGKTLLVFSYHENNQENKAGIPITDQDFSGFNNILVFIPMASAVHMDEVVFSWKPSFPITYIASQDLKGKVPERSNIRFVQEGDSFSVADAAIRVCGATDEGVSFLVKTHGVSVYHAGDLNLWHWREQSSPQVIAKAEQTFYETVERIPHEPLDVCMFPLDPNQGGYYDAGANHIIMTLKPRVFFPMHFGNRSEIAQDYARRMHSRRTNVTALTTPRETAQIDLSRNPPVVLQMTGESQQGELPDKLVSLSTYLEDNPFAETDLPVNLQEEPRE